MEIEEMARILYNLSLDMDGADYEETRDKDIQGLIQDLKELNEDSYLYNALSIICESNEEYA